MHDCRPIQRMSSRGWRPSDNRTIHPRCVRERGQPNTEGREPVETERIVATVSGGRYRAHVCEPSEHKPTHTRNLHIYIYILVSHDIPLDTGERLPPSQLPESGVRYTCISIAILAQAIWQARTRKRASCIVIQKFHSGLAHGVAHGVDVSMVS